MSTSEHPSMFDAIEAGRAGARSTASHADTRWVAAAKWHIRTMVAGTTFLAEDVARMVAERGVATEDARALGQVILDAKRDGLIEATGQFGRARTSHGSPKTIWRRVRAEPTVRGETR